MNNKKELTLDEIQNGSFEILKKIKEIFDQNDWKYYLTAGTLLGAVRHKGFIPWDDDVDLWIPRQDYEKFINYCINHKDDLKPYELIHYKTNDKYIYPIARFSDSRYKIDYNNVNDYGLGLFVDLYPLDGFNQNDKKFKKKMYRLKRLIVICGSKKMIKSKNKIKNILKYPYCFIVKHLNLNLNKLLRKCDLKAQKYSYDKYDSVECVCWADQFYTYNKKDIVSFEKTLKFNDINFRVPCNYDKILKRMYGNYLKMPPKEQQIGHHFYKAYRKK